jgi:hypothetical protein
MAGRKLLFLAAATSAGLILSGVSMAIPAVPAGAAGAAGAAGTATLAASSARCSAGAHTLSAPGSRLYPETGNGGYTSIHTLVHLVYNAKTNRFLPGNKVVLADRAT